MAALACKIIHVGADSATEKHAHLADAVMASQLIEDSAVFDWNSFIRRYPGLDMEETMESSSNLY